MSVKLLTDIMLTHPMTYPRSWRLLSFTPTFRVAARVALKTVVDDLYLPAPVDVFAPLGGALEVVSKLVKVGHSLATKAWYTSPAGQAWKIEYKLWEDISKAKQLLQGHQQVYEPSGTGSQALGVIRNQLGTAALSLQDTAFQDATQQAFRAQV